MDRRILNKGKGGIYKMKVIPWHCQSRYYGNISNLTINQSLTTAPFRHKIKTLSQNNRLLAQALQLSKRELSNKENLIVNNAEKIMNIVNFSRLKLSDMSEHMKKADACLYEAVSMLNLSSISSPSNGSKNRLAVCCDFENKFKEMAVLKDIAIPEEENISESVPNSSNETEAGSKIVGNHLQGTTTVSSCNVSEITKKNSKGKGNKNPSNVQNSNLPKKAPSTRPIPKNLSKSKAASPTLNVKSSNKNIAQANVTKSQSGIRRKSIVSKKTSGNEEHLNAQPARKNVRHKLKTAPISEPAEKIDRPSLDSIIDPSETKTAPSTCKTAKQVAPKSPQSTSNPPKEPGNFGKVELAPASENARIEVKGLGKISPETDENVLKKCSVVGDEQVKNYYNIGNRNLANKKPPLASIDVPATFKDSSNRVQSNSDQIGHRSDSKTKETFLSDRNAQETPNSSSGHSKKTNQTTLSTNPVLKPIRASGANLPDSADASTMKSNRCQLVVDTEQPGLKRKSRVQFCFDSDEIIEQLSKRKSVVKPKKIKKKRKYTDVGDENVPPIKKSAKKQILNYDNSSFLVTAEVHCPPDGYDCDRHTNSEKMVCIQNMQPSVVLHDIYQSYKSAVESSSESSDSGFPNLLGSNKTDKDSLKKMVQNAEKTRKCGKLGKNSEKEHKLGEMKEGRCRFKTLSYKEPSLTTKMRR